MEFISHSEKETLELASMIAAKLHGGSVLALSGDLGSGKTTFVKALAGALGIDKTITSPTFVLLKQYEAARGDIRLLVHVDAYRMKSANDACAIGLDEYLFRDDTVVAIEWPEKIKELLPKEAIWLNFSYIRGNIRKISAADGLI